MSQRNVNSTGVSHWLIHCAARHAPHSFAQRLEEEWLAHLAERPSSMSRLRFAIGCCWATRVIAREHGPAAVPATSPATAAGFASMDFGDLLAPVKYSVLGRVVARRGFLHSHDRGSTHTEGESRAVGESADHHASSRETNDLHAEHAGRGNLRKPAGV